MVTQDEDGRRAIDWLHRFDRASLGRRKEGQRPVVAIYLFGFRGRALFGFGSAGGRTAAVNPLLLRFAGPSAEVCVNLFLLLFRVGAIASVSVWRVE